MARLEISLVSGGAASAVKLQLDRGRLFLLDPRPAVGDKIIMSLDGQTGEFEVKSLGPSGSGLLEKSGASSADLDRLLLKWVAAAFRIPSRWTPEWFSKAALVTQSIATLIAAAGLYFGLLGLVNQNELPSWLSGITSSEPIDLMVASVAGFVIAWAIALGFQTVSYLKKV